MSMPSPSEASIRNVSTPVSPLASSAVRPSSIDDTRITGGFWKRLQDLNRNATLPHEVSWINKFGAVGNFDAVQQGRIAKNRVGREFADSDVYKVIEALSWEEGRVPSAPFEQAVLDLAAKIKSAQSEDGYVNTKFGNPGQEPRYSAMEWGHELYCYGHLIQAAVARLRTGKNDTDPVVQLGISVADHVCDTFGENGLQLVDGHPEIEPALVELYRATGDERYLSQARLFIDRRGHKSLKDIEFGRSYFQDTTPVREMGVLEGHAVRALYLAAGAIDLAVETSDSELLEAIEKQYRNTLARRTYITGGMGSHHQDEAFGDDFELPPDRAYCETCAGVASIMVAWRLLLATGDITWGDIIERTLYNVLATSISDDGTAFFYANPLHQRVPVEATDRNEWSPRASASQRSSWFEVSCCPPNLSRTLAQLGSYAATSSADRIQLVQYFDSTIHAELESGPVDIRVHTDYPQSGQIQIEVLKSPDKNWTLELRIPSWGSGAKVQVSGQTVLCEPGSHEVTGLVPGSQVLLSLPVQPRITFPDPRIDAVRDCVAVERGPLVMCLESKSQTKQTDVSLLTIDPSVPLVDDIERVIASGRVLIMTDEEWPYERTRASHEVETKAVTQTELVFTPYLSWGEQEGATMRVWVPVVRNS